MVVEVRKTVNGQAEELWNYIADFSNIIRFHPFLSKSEFIEGNNQCDVGGTRLCEMKDGSYVKERITEWEEGSHYKVEIYESSMPFKRAFGTVGVNPVGNNQAEIYMKMEVEPKNKLMQPMLYVMMRRKLLPGVLKGLENLHIKETEMQSA